MSIIPQLKKLIVQLLGINDNTATKRIKYLGINLPKETKTCMQKTLRH